LGAARPFEFVGEPRFATLPESDQNLVDHPNGLRLRTYQWPEFNFTVVLEPAEGIQADAWPLSKRAYYEFGMAPPVRLSDGRNQLAVSFAIAHEPSERDFPGRAGELLDVVLPLILPLFGQVLAQPVDDPLIPVMLRDALLRDGRYFPSRDGWGPLL
jgi:hypothetical protein